MKIKKGIAILSAFLGLGLASCGSNVNTTTPTSSIPTNDNNSISSETETQVKAKYEIIINNTSSDSNNSTSVNGLHVYDMEDKELNDVTSHSKFDEGHKIGVYMYNMASDVKLIITHNNETIEREYKTYYWAGDESKIEFFEFNLKSDLIVSASVIDLPETYNVVTKGLVEGLNITYMSRTGTNPDNFKISPITNQITEGESLLASITNTTDKEYNISVKVGGKKIELGEQFSTISKGSADEPSMGGFMIDEANIKGTIIVEFSEIKETSSISVDNKVSSEVAEIYLNLNQINGKTEVNKDTYTLYIYKGDVSDYSIAEVYITIDDKDPITLDLLTLTEYIPYELEISPNSSITFNATLV